MRLKYKRLGDYIRLVDNRNKDLSVNNLLGINITKNFMPSVANISGTDLSRYKIIKRNQFATNIMHVGRDGRLPIALFKENEAAIVSPAYITFEVIDVNKVLPEYLMIEFNRPEFDRLTWFYCDSSIRGGLEWERFCDIEIPIPDIREQIKYVALYISLINNQETYKKSLDDLQTVCNSYLDKLINNHIPVPLGEHIELTDSRNSDGQVKKLLGVNIKKSFMLSKVNVSKTSLLNYRIIIKGDFAANVMHVGRDEMLPVSLYLEAESAIVSPAYKTFRIKENSDLLSEFLMLWFFRPQFDRLTWYYCDSSVRGGLDWDRFCEIKIPIPSLEVQKSIVTIYHTLQTRKRITEQLKNTIKPLCPILMKGVVKDLEREVVLV